MTYNNTAIQVDKDFNGNVTIIIKLVIPAAYVHGPILDTVIVDIAQGNQTPHSENLLESNSDNDNITITNDCAAGSEGNDISDDTAEVTDRAPYSLRSWVCVEEDDSEEDYKVDYELSQQVSNFNF